MKKQPTNHEDNSLMNLSPIQKMSRDVKEAARTLSDEEARYLVDTYYQMQDDRIRVNSRVRSMNESCTQIVTQLRNEL